MHTYLDNFGEDWPAHIDDEVDYDKNEIGRGVVVFENIDARFPLDRQLFQGRFDEHWGARTVITLTRVFAGSGVLECDALDDFGQGKGRSTPRRTPEEPISPGAQSIPTGARPVPPPPPVPAGGAVALPLFTPRAGGGPVRPSPSRAVNPLRVASLRPIAASVPRRTRAARGLSPA